MLDRLDDLREDLGHNDFADDVNGAKKGMEQHNDLRRKISKIPVDTIDAVGQRILQRLSTSEGSYDSGYSGGGGTRDSSGKDSFLL